MNLARAMLVSTLVVAAVPPSARAAEERAAGVIIAISPTGRAKLTPADRDAADLKPEDLGRLVYVGDTLNCSGANALVRVHLDKGITVPRGRCGADACCTDGVTLTFSAAGSGPAEADPGDVAGVLARYKRAGREKGAECPIYSPADGEAVLAGSFVIRWRTRPPLGMFTAVLRDGSGSELARVAGVDGASGVLEAPAMRQALERYSGSAGEEHPARLVFRFELAPETGVAFRVLSKQQEMALSRALEARNSATGLLRCLERASTYNAFGMYGPVAAEYDAALKEAPKSADLLSASMSAHARIGDLRRARELWEELQQVEGSSTR